MKEKQVTKKVQVVYYPYTTQYGEIEVPAELRGDELRDYIQEHIDFIKFGEPILEYAGTDFDIEE